MPTRVLRHSLAATAPLLCAIHCVATPVLVAVLPAFVMSHAAEVGMFATSGALVGWAIRSGTRVHRQVGPALLAAFGLSAWGGQLFGALPTPPGEVGLALAALITAVGLVWNARLRHRAAAIGCSCASCVHPAAD